MLSVSAGCGWRGKCEFLQVKGEGAGVRWGVCVTYVCVKCVYVFTCSYVIA